MINNLIYKVKVNEEQLQLLNTRLHSLECLRIRLSGSLLMVEHASAGVQICSGYNNIITYKTAFKLLFTQRCTRRSSSAIWQSGIRQHFVNWIVREEFLLVFFP